MICGSAQKFPGSWPTGKSMSKSLRQDVLLDFRKLTVKEHTWDKTQTLENNQSEGFLTPSPGRALDFQGYYCARTFCEWSMSRSIQVSPWPGHSLGFWFPWLVTKQTRLEFSGSHIPGLEQIHVSHRLPILILRVTVPLPHSLLGGGMYYP